MPPRQAHVAVAVDENSGRNRDIVYAPNEHLKLVPYAFSYLRWILYWVLALCTGGLLLVVTAWFPEFWTRIARMRLPASCEGQADYVLVLLHDDGLRTQWVERKVFRAKIDIDAQETQPKESLMTPLRRLWQRMKAIRSMASTQDDGDDENNDMDDDNGDAAVLADLNKRTMVPESSAKPLAKKASSKFWSIETKPADLAKKKKKEKLWVWFECKKHRYVFNEETGEFERYLSTICEDWSAVLARIECGLTQRELEQKSNFFASNLVEIDLPSVPFLLFTKLMHPYYLFQIFSSTLWFLESYTIYAIVILSLSALSMLWEIASEVWTSYRLQRLVRSDHALPILRDGITAKMHERELFPGDIVEIETGSICADMLLLSGSCVVDESSLTGEAFPVTKEPVKGVMAQITEADARKEYRASFLHAGSSITQIRRSDGVCKGLVLSTGFSTGKGELFRSILFPKPITFAFERDSYRYLGVLSAIAIAAFIKRLTDGSKAGESFGVIVVDSLDLITIAVPPALPLVLSSGVGIALQRLLKRGIFCIDAQRINLCGQLSCYCFDKTGTLTQEHMNLVGVDVVENESESLKHVGLELPDKLRLAMATCHGLTQHEDKLQGYPLDVSMFEASDFTLDTQPDKAKGDYQGIVMTTSFEFNAGDETLSRVSAQEPGDAVESGEEADTAAKDIESMGNRHPREFGIVRQFPFDPARQRSSVIVQDLSTRKRYVFVKGSPEAIRAITTSLPDNFADETHAHASHGYYCIGFGMKELPEDTAINVNDRDAIESKLTSLLGIALFKNELKPESKNIIQELYRADMDVRVITGDHALTAVRICQELGMQLKPNVAVVDVDEATGDTMYYRVDEITSVDTVLELRIKTQGFNKLNQFIATCKTSPTKLQLDIQQTLKRLDEFQMVRQINTYRAYSIQELDRWKANNTMLNGMFMNASPELLRAMALCHDVKLVDGKVQGSSVQRVQFFSANAKFAASEFNGVELDGGKSSGAGSYVALRRFRSGGDDGSEYNDDDSTETRVVVVVEETKSKERFVLVSGSPEAMIEPLNLDFQMTQFERFAEVRLFPILFASKRLAASDDIDDVEQLEEDLEIIGLTQMWTTGQAIVPDLVSELNPPDQSWRCFCASEMSLSCSKTLAGVECVAEDAADTSGMLKWSSCTTTTAPSIIRLAMATCHDLFFENNQVSGSSTDLTLLRESNATWLGQKQPRDGAWDLVVVDGALFGVMKRFPSDESTPYSTVVAVDLKFAAQCAVVKGSPAAIIALCRPDSVPKDIEQQLRAHETQGHYCQAVAWCERDHGYFVGETRLDIEYTDSRRDPEFTFVGLLFFAKESASSETRANTLNNAPSIQDIEIVRQRQSVVLPREPMSDENHWLTFNGSNMSRVMMQYEIALTGAALDKLLIECSEESIHQLLRQTQIFARTRPQQKTWIVEQLMEMGHTVGMCGDGTNDCGALKAAHVGLALSSAEASIVAPFTSKAKQITDVPVLVREGRCALTTSFLGFKFMVLYPIIQLGMASTLAHLDLILTNNQYIWDDMGIVLGLALLMLYTGASHTLVPQRPSETLFSPDILASIVGQVLIFIAFFAGHFALLRNQSGWFCSIENAFKYLDGDNSHAASCAIYLEYNTPDNPYSYEDTCVWLFGHMQYISVAAAFNIKDPYRLAFYTNWAFTALFLAVLGVNLWFLLDTSGVINSTFQLMPIPFSYRWKMLVMFIGHFIASIGWEFIATRIIPKMCSKPRSNLKSTL